jgi:hypothetical protein
MKHAAKLMQYDGIVHYSLVLELCLLLAPRKNNIINSVGQQILNSFNIRLWAVSV